MTPPQDRAAAPAGAGPTSWREQAVARSLDPARVRAEKRVQRFLDAAFELMQDSPSRDFTVQQVVERSGQSLRSFYQYFAGKHELLLALFEETVRSTVERLEAATVGIDDPMERLQAFLVEYHRICSPASSGRSRRGESPYPTALVDFAQQLLTAHPREAAVAFGPLVASLEQLLAEAAAAGALREGLDHRRVAGVVLQSVMFTAFATTISGAPVRSADDGALLDLLLHGVAQPSPRGRR